MTNLERVERAIAYLEPITKHPTMTGQYCEHLKTASTATARARRSAERPRLRTW